MKRWAWNDAWILTATLLVHENRGATLAQILGASDALNHVLPSRGQLSRAFSRLAGCGLLRVRSKRYLVPAAHRSAIRKVLQSEGGVFDMPANCLKWLKNSGIEPASSDTMTVSESNVQAAYEAYIDSLKRKPQKKRSGGTR